MKKVLALNGSPRPCGNTSHLLQAFVDGTLEHNAETEVIHSHHLRLDDCTGCLRCNLLKRCSISGDDWADLSYKILDSDVLVFASPVYFHHVPASLKRVIDRFRSFAHVQITETGLVHTPHQEWCKDFVLILSLGSPDPSDARPVIDLFNYVSAIMGTGNTLHVITATRLAMVNQVIKSEEELLALYRKIRLPEKLAPHDYRKNAALLIKCRELGRRLAQMN
jgi:multimeric flavodoxin WrbA